MLEIMNSMETLAIVLLIVGCLFIGVLSLTTIASFMDWEGEVKV